MKRLFPLMLILVFLMAACRPQTVPVTPALPSETPARTPTLNPTPTPIPEPLKTLTICTAQLPESLFPYDGSKNTAKVNLLTILYEDPFKPVNVEGSAGMLAQIPTLENADLRLEPVTVQRGQTVVDAEGNLAVLKPGLLVHPSGCRSADCAVVWDGEGTLQMDRMVVDFRLRQDLSWSDGAPVAAGDSVFSFQLADDPQAPGLHWAEDRTDAYRALDAQTVQWLGRPGFATGDLSQVFWNPLPAQLFTGSESWPELVSAEALANSPLSYGPFQVQSREPGRILLIPNPYYYRAEEGLPLLDELVFRQMDGGRASAIQALQSGECHVLDASFGWENDLDFLSEIEADENVEIQLETGEAWWQLAFGIKPAAYDDYYSPNLGDRPDIFGDPGVRRAFASCLDREALRERALGGWSSLWQSFLPPGTSQISQEDGLYYDPEQGNISLEAAGWLDYDADPETPRIAMTVPDVPVGTELRLELLVDETGFQQEMGGIIQESLAGCGIGVDIRTLPSQQLYAAGPEGPLFGRRFDLALIAWEAGPELDCRLYLDQAIPDEANQWVGTNISGFAEPDYDRACASAELALENDRINLLQQAERAFLNHLPAIPLFSMPRISLISSSVCAVEKLTQGKGFINYLESVAGRENCP